MLHHHDQVPECRGKTRETSWRIRCDHDDDAECKQSERSQVQELRGAMHIEERKLGNARKIVLA